MSKHDGGKGDAPRPLGVSLMQFDAQFDAIFGKPKVRLSCPICGKSPTWCECKEKKGESND